MIELLIKHQANINLPGGDERVTVLHEAVTNDEPDENLIKFLLENGADPQLKNKQNQTARDLAVASSNAKLVALFQNVRCQNASSNEQAIAPPVRRRGRTTSNTPILFFTGFEKSRKDTLMKAIQSTFGRKFVSTTKNVENNGKTIERRVPFISFCSFSDAHHRVWRNRSHRFSNDQLSSRHCSRQMDSQ